MRCPSCGANVDSAYCGYCGTKMPIERVETQSINGDHVVINNYYYQQPSNIGGYQASNQRSTAYANAAPVYANASYSNESSKSRLVALLLCFFLGYFGAHRFYVGRYLLGVVYLFTIGLFGIGYLVDLVLIVLGKMKDRDGRYVVRWQ